MAFLVVVVVVVVIGALTDDSLIFLAEIRSRATLCIADLRETTFLYQRISVEIEHFNAVCLANSLTVSESPALPFQTILHFDSF